MPWDASPGSCIRLLPAGRGRQPHTRQTADVLVEDFLFAHVDLSFLCTKSNWTSLEKEQLCKPLTLSFSLALRETSPVADCDWPGWVSKQTCCGSSGLFASQLPLRRSQLSISARAGLKQGRPSKPFSPFQASRPGGTVPWQPEPVLIPSSSL